MKNRHELPGAAKPQPKKEKQPRKRHGDHGKTFSMISVKISVAKNLCLFEQNLTDSITNFKKRIREVRAICSGLAFVTDADSEINEPDHWIIF